MFALVGMQGLQVALSFLVSFLLSRTLGAENFGIYAYCFGLMVFLAIPLQTGFSSLIVRTFSAATSDDNWSRARGLVRRAQQLCAIYVIAIATAGAAYLLLAGPVNPLWLKTWLFSLLTLPLLALIAVRASSLNGLGRTLTGQFFESVLRPLLFVTMLFVPVTFGWISLTPATAMGLHFAAFALTLLALDAGFRRAAPRAARDAPPAYDDRAWLGSFGTFVMLAAAQMLTQHADFLILGFFATSAEVGVYRVASQTALLVSLPMTAIGLALAPQLSRSHATGDVSALEKSVRTYTQLAFALCLAPALILLSFGTGLLGAIFGPEFATGSDALKILVIGQVFNCLAGPLGLLMNMTGHEKQTFRAFMAAAAANLGLTMALTPPLGLVGAAIANASSLVLWNAILIVATHRHLGIRTLLSPVRAEMAWRPPTFFIIGAPKSGTTSLSEWLKGHPSVFIPSLKEPQFFNTDHRYVYPRLSEMSYRRLFRNATTSHAAIGEASTWYLHSETAVPNILRRLPHARFIVCLRNPVEMAVSLHQHLIADLELPPMSFESRWRELIKRGPFPPDKHPFLHYPTVCKLGEALERLYKAVPRDRVLVLLLDDIRRNPRLEYLRVLDFIGVPDDGRSDFPLANVSAEPRSRTLTYVIRSIGRLKAMTAIPAFRWGLLDYFRRLNSQPTRSAKLAADFTSELQAYFTKDIHLLSTLIGRDLSNWFVLGRLIPAAQNDLHEQKHAP